MIPEVCQPSLCCREYEPDDDLSLIWKEFLPHAQKYWQLQHESWSAGNCKDWWKSRFYSCFVGHGHGKEMIEHRLHHFERGTFDKFPDFWRRYGHVLMSHYECPACKNACK